MRNIQVICHRRYLHISTTWVGMWSLCVFLVSGASELFAANTTAPKRTAHTWPTKCVPKQPTVTGGKKDGAEWMCTPDGKWMMARFWKNGSPHGPTAMWHSNGKKAAEGSYWKGKEHGLWQMWYPNGQPSQFNFYLFGKTYGPKKQWFPNGQLQFEVYTKKNVFHGLQRIWYMDGTLKFSGRWIAGKECGSFYTYNTEGKLADKQSYKACPKTLIPFTSRKQSSAVAQRAVFVRERAKKVGSTKQLDDSMYTSLQSYKALLLGGFPGTVEFPALVGGLASLFVKKGDKVLLGLDWPVSMQPLLDAFMRDGKPSHLQKHLMFLKKHRDGRSSSAMVSLLQRLRSLKGVTVFCTRPLKPTQDPSEGIARLILSTYAKHKGARLLLIGDLLQSRVDRGMWAAVKRLPVGYRLSGGKAFAAGDLLAIRVRNRDGKAWMCQSTAGCRVYNVRFFYPVYHIAAPFVPYFLKERTLLDGYHASLYLGTLTPSKPQ